jgi:hypothetical protein
MPHTEVPKVKCDDCDAMLPLADLIKRPDLKDVFVSEWTCHWRRRRLCPSCSAKAPYLPNKDKESIMRTTQKGQTNVFYPMGRWQETGPGYYIWTGPNVNTSCSLTIFGQQFHTLAIQTKGEDEQVALHPENQAELDALHTAGGTSEGYSEIEVDGHPAVVFLVPFDR